MPDNPDTPQNVMLQDFVSAIVVDSGSEITVQWVDGSDSSDDPPVVNLIQQALEQFRTWRDRNFPNWRADEAACTEDEPCDH